MRDTVAHADYRGPHTLNQSRTSGAGHGGTRGLWGEARGKPQSQTFPKADSINPQFQTQILSLRPTPWTVNTSPTAYTLNPQLQTLNPEPQLDSGGDVNLDSQP